MPVVFYVLPAPTAYFSQIRPAVCLQMNVRVVKQARLDMLDIAILRQALVKVGARRVAFAQNDVVHDQTVTTQYDCMVDHGTMAHGSDGTVVGHELAPCGRLTPGPDALQQVCREEERSQARTRRPPQRSPRRDRLCRMRRQKAETGVLCPIPLPEGMSSEHRTRWHDKDQEYPSEAALCRVSDYLVSF